MVEDVPKMPKKRKSKAKRPSLLIHDSDDDVSIQGSLNNLVVIDLSFSNLEALFHASKKQKTISSPNFDMPPKHRGMMIIVPPLPAIHLQI